MLIPLTPPSLNSTSPYSHMLLFSKLLSITPASLLSLLKYNKLCFLSKTALLLPINLTSLPQTTPRFGSAVTFTLLNFILFNPCTLVVFSAHKLGLFSTTLSLSFFAKLTKVFPPVATISLRLVYFLLSAHITL